MKLSVEITLYPLHDNYLTIIQACIDKLNTYDNIRLQTFPTATILSGEFERVMQVVSDIVAWTYSEYGKSVFVCKFLPNYEAL